MGRPEETAAREASAGAAQKWRSPGPAPALALAANNRDPRDSEIDRGTEEDDDATRRRWFLRRRQWCQCVRLTLANLGEPSIAAKDVARGGGDEHGGAQPRHGRLQRTDGDTATTGDSTSFGGVPMT